MGCDTVVALGKSTGGGRALFGHNSGRHERERQRLQRTIGRSYALGEKVSTGKIELPQARCTHTVLGSQADGMWGYHHGVNELNLAVGCTQVRNRLEGGTAGLSATDLVRLALERAGGALQAVDLLTDLLARHGQARSDPSHGTDGAFLIADAREAFVLETAGSYWVVQEVREVRAVSDACTIRQDWNRIAPGLSGQVIQRHWWPEDGTKIDFAGVLGSGPTEGDSALKRWARASYLLQEQNGHIDVAFLRRLLGDHYETEGNDGEATTAGAQPMPICQHDADALGCRTAISFIAELGAAAEALPLAWCAFGPPCCSVYFPLFLAGTLPEAFTRGGLDQLGIKVGAGGVAGSAGPSRSAAREALVRLQEQFDQEAAEFQHEALVWKRQGKLDELQRQATLFHQHALESFERTLEGLVPERAAAAPRDGVLEPAAGAVPVPWA